jgi:hypothetical protein
MIPAQTQTYCTRSSNTVAFELLQNGENAGCRVRPWPGNRLTIAVGEVRGYVKPYPAARRSTHESHHTDFSTATRGSGSVG